MNPTSTATAHARSDAAVLAAAREEPSRFAEVYDRHHHAVFRYARSRVGDQQCDDVVADTFVEAFRSRARFDAAPGESCLPWLLGITTNVIARRRGAERAWLRAGRVPREPDTTGDAFADADARLAVQGIAPWLRYALGELRRRDRDALLLHVTGDLSIDEVAVAMGIAPGTVKSRLHRARRILAAQLEARR